MYFDGSVKIIVVVVDDFLYGIRLELVVGSCVGVGFVCLGGM